MAYKYHLSKEAEEDILEAYLWYEQEQEGLGEEFLQILESAKKAILKNPATYRIRYKNIRSYLINRFPYMILYLLEKQEIYVVSVFHTSRNPRRWKKRNPKS